MKIVFLCADMDEVQEQGALLWGNDKKNFENHNITINGIWRVILSLKLKLCSWGRKHFVHTCLSVKIICIEETNFGTFRKKFNSNWSCFEVASSTNLHKFIYNVGFFSLVKIFIFSTVQHWTILFPRPPCSVTFKYTIFL